MKSLIISIVFTLSSQVFAMDGSSGCGPAWYILKDNSLVSSALRATTNGIFGLTVTIGMTVGTSNCTKHKIVKTEQKTLHFVNENYFELMAQATQGQGEYLTNLAATIGCHNRTQDHFNQKIQTQFSKIFKKEKKSASETLLEVYKVILTDKELTQSCSLS